MIKHYKLLINYSIIHLLNYSVMTVKSKSLYKLLCYPSSSNNNSLISNKIMPKLWSLKQIHKIPLINKNLLLNYKHLKWKLPLDQINSSKTKVNKKISFFSNLFQMNNKISLNLALLPKYNKIFKIRILIYNCLKSLNKINPAFNNLKTILIQVNILVFIV